MKNERINYIDGLRGIAILSFNYLKLLKKFLNTTINDILYKK